ncbi:MAG: PIG-L family deacetylase [Holophagaceae bacterium]|nr:PIG-L family deacetylase [Holophagaceae bacterium]
MFQINTSEIFIPDAISVEKALVRITHLAIAAHQDDIEIMAFQGIVDCFGKVDEWFAGVTVTNGSGSPRDDLYANTTDEDMQKIRRTEQKKAAYMGEYGAQVFLDYGSAIVKDGKNMQLVEDLVALLQATRPRVIYTHNLADKHDTHVAVALRTISAIRQIPKDMRPERVIGCEVWRDQDWLCDSDKVVMDVSRHENLATALLGVYDSQICGGKRYDLATLGRRHAHATFFASHGVDDASALSFGCDLTPLIKDDRLEPSTYIDSLINNFSIEVQERIKKVE